MSQWNGTVVMPLCCTCPVDNSVTSPTEEDPSSPIQVTEMWLTTPRCADHVFPGPVARQASRANAPNT